MGTPEFARVHLEALLGAGVTPVAVFTREDKPAGRGRVLTPPPVKVLAGAAGVPVFQPKTLKDPEVVKVLADLRPDAVAVVAYGRLLPREVLDIPPLGCVNVHASLLPRHRGASPIAHAIWAGDGETGVCTMRMEEGLDTGPVYLRRAIAVPPGATTGSLTPVLASLGADLLVETLAGLATGALEAHPQDDALATLAPRIRADAGRLDFRRPAVELERQIRAFDPWPGTFFESRGRRVKLLRAAVGEAPEGGLPPGSVVVGPPLGVVCGDGRCLLPELMQREGKRPQPAEEFLRGFPLIQGEILAREG